MRVNIETDRLVIRNIEIDDYEAVFGWCGDPEVNTYMIYNLYHKAEDLKPWIGSMDIDDANMCETVFILKDTGEIIGGGGIHYEEEDDAWEVGYNLRRDCWGHGYVPEAMQGIVDFIRSIRDVRAIKGTFCVDNIASKRVLEKLGMIYHADCEYWKADGSQRFEAKTFIKKY